MRSWRTIFYKQTLAHHGNLKTYSGTMADKAKYLTFRDAISSNFLEQFGSATANSSCSTPIEV